MKRKIFTALLFSSLALSALPAGAVSYDSQHYVFRFNNKGTTFRVLPPHANHFCYLSGVGVANTDIEEEEAMCRVRRSGSVWLLEATLGQNNDANVRCWAICYNH